MHPEVVAEEFGRCPICGMDLEKRTGTLEDHQSAQNGHEGHDHEVGDRVAKAQRDDSAEAMYVCVDSEPQEWNEFIRWIARQLGLPEPSSSVEAPSRRSPRNRRCSNARLRTSGYAFHYPSCRAIE